MKKISVIVPIYNVEEYLEECFDSLANQDFDDYEVLMINDGSTDGSQEICESYEELYPYFKLYNKPNGGLGQARNYGMDRAFGDFYFFVDSDDIITEDALSKLYSEAIKNDSDIVTGNVVRFNSKRFFSSKLHSMGEFSEYKAITTLEETPELIYDVTSWNKLYRRSFMLENRLRFPEGIIYEDIPVTIPAHYLSKRTTIVPDIIYHWRERDGATKSLSQRNRELTNFHDRMKVLGMVDEFFEEEELPDYLKVAKMKRWLNLDFPIFINLLKGANESYIKSIVEGLQYYFETHQDIKKYFNTVSYDLQLYYNLLTANDYSYEKLRALMDWIENNPIVNADIRFVDGKYSIQSDYDNNVYDLTTFMNTQRISRRLDKVTFEKNFIQLEGYGFHRFINVGSKDIVSLEGKLFRNGSNEGVSVDVKSKKYPIVSFRHGGEITSNLTLKTINVFDNCGVEVKIPYEKLDLDSTYKIEITVTTKQGQYSYFIGGPTKGRDPRPAPLVRANATVSVNYDSNWDLSIVNGSTEAVVTSVEVNEDTLEIKGWVPDNANFYESAFNNWQDKKYLIAPLVFTKREEGKNYFEYKVNLSETKLFRENSNWFFYIRKDRERILPVVQNEILQDYLVNDSYVFSQMTSGIFKLRVVKENAKAANISIASDKIALTIRKDKKEESARFVLRIKRNANQEIFDTELVENSPGLWSANLDLTNPSLRQLGSGIWTVRLLTIKEDSIDEEGLIYTGGENEQPILSNKFKFKVFQTSSLNLAFRILPKFDFLTDGPRRRKFYELNVYPLLRKLPLKRKNVIFESFWGKEFSDNPKAIYEYMDKNMKDFSSFWAMQDSLPLIDGGGEVLQIGTSEYYNQLAQAKFLINNVNFPNHYVKRDDAVEINTMHGVPLKKMGFDFADDFPNEKAKELFQEKINRWDYVISPSKYVSNIIRSAFNYTKEILEFGYPRNDELLRDNTEQVNRVRETLEIPNGKKVIVYAPTWRERGVLDVQIDFDRWEREFSDEYVLVVRYHHYNSATIAKTKYTDFVLNGNIAEVSVNDVMAAADVLITDYSSIMFDYSLLNKSLLFYVYDSEEYANDLRGMYFDLQEEFPEICFEQEEDLIAALHGIEELSRYSEKIALKFNEFDDGKASERVAKFISKNA